MPEPHAKNVQALHVAKHFKFTSPVKEVMKQSIRFCLSVSSLTGKTL